MARLEMSSAGGRVRHFSLLRSGLRRTETAPCGDSHRGPPSAIPLGFARGFGKAGQAFSKSVRSGAPQLVSPNDQRQPELHSPLLMWLTRLDALSNTHSPDISGIPP